MPDKRKDNGGAREGSGRKSKADEDKAKALIRQALKSIYSKDGDDENTVAFLKDFAQTPKGQQFVAEHLLGKPKENLNFSGDISMTPMEWVK